MSRKTEPEPAAGARGGGRTDASQKNLRRAPNTISRPELLVNGRDLHFRELVNSLLALSARHEAVRAAHAAFIGLPAPQYTILVAAAHRAAEGPIRIKDLADLLSVSQTFITMELKKLYQRGLMVKTRSDQDSRMVDLFVTDKGFDLLEELAPVQRQVNDEQFAEISSDEFNEYLRLTRILVTNSDRALALYAYLTQGREPAGRDAKNTKTA